MSHFQPEGFGKTTHSQQTQHWGPVLLHSQHISFVSAKVKSLMSEATSDPLSFVVLASPQLHTSLVFLIPPLHPEAALCGK